ncbi:hypothetical protein [Spiroplasma floricola]|uniref:Transmembrane protein n=1 Tax=Spiroplasma floricola 23-6 TaxID=1336749 RepID=A0A2K8SET8_9MOLU|nr:hypothetical protein [Spiroplasma floricola]AUB31768.1 hypothetical protein SFLOR_v1c07200 [Spiroplasma floricola 23-6]
MKKILSILGSTVLVAPLVSTTTFNTKNISNEINNKKDDVNWNYIDQETNNIFEKLVNNSNSQFYSDDNQNITNEVLKFAKQETKKLLNSFKNEQKSLEEMIKYFENNVDGFKENLDKQTSNNSIYNLLNLDSYEKIKKNISKTWFNSLLDDMNLVAGKLGWGAIALAAAAAGFWAAAWWFGISIPFAIDCARVAAVLTVCSAGLGLTVAAFREKLNSIWDVLTWSLNSYRLYSTIGQIAIPKLLIVKTTLSASIVGYITSAVLVPIIGNLLFKLYKGAFE